MERLTVVTEDMWAIKGKIDEAVFRLAAIEDILGDDYDLDRLKVIVNQRMTMREEVAERFRITKDVPVERLKELVEADRDGRCVVLPCKIGSLVYSHARKLDGQDYMKETEFWWSDIPELGKTVFLNPEAAEAALKGEQDG